ncbi:MAG: ATP-binding protein [Patescibacteria group bacterium]
MVTQTHTASFIGETPINSTIIVETKRGVPEIIVHGLAVKEAREIKQRILMAFHHADLRLKAKRTLISVKQPKINTKACTDLAIAAALYYKNSNIIPDDTICYIGQITSNGTVHGSLENIPAIIAAKQLGFKKVVIPGNLIEKISWLTGIDIYSLNHLSELLKLNRVSHSPLRITTKHTELSEKHQAALAAYPLATRALQITATGGHHVLLLGPPGWGKSTLSQAAAALLPDLSTEEVESILSSSQNSTTISQALCRRPLFHTITTRDSLKDIFGSARTGAIGMIAQNLHGTMVFDELPAFSPSSLQALRSTLDFEPTDWQFSDITIHRRQRTTIIATGNPCRCGNWKSAAACHCSKAQRNHYWIRLGTALLDRFQLHLWIDEQYEFNKKMSLDIEQIRQSIKKARLAQKKRYSTWLLRNAQADWELLSPNLDNQAMQQLKRAAIQLQLSLRAALHTLRIARTIADLSDSDTILQTHILEALQYRPIITPKDLHV